MDVGMVEDVIWSGFCGNGSDANKIKAINVVPPILGNCFALFKSF